MEKEELKTTPKKKPAQTVETTLLLTCFILLSIGVAAAIAWILIFK